VIRRPAWSPRRSCQSQRPRALAGRANLRDGQPPEPPPAGVGWTGCGVPPASLQGYHTPARGQSRTTDAPVPSRAAPELARGRAAPGRRDATRPPACKIDTRAVAGPSNVEKYREPGEAPRAFLLANPTASVYWRRRRNVGRTSWPVSRIQREPSINLPRWGLRANSSMIVRQQQGITIFGNRRTARSLRGRHAVSTPLR
jgi:hypothetical protein